MTSPYVSGGLIGMVIIAAASGAVYFFEPSVPAVHWPKIENPLKRESLKPKAGQPLPSQAGCNDQLTLKVAQNIQDHPDQWKADQWRMERDGGLFGDDVSIWIANEDYGLDFLTRRIMTF
jgi:hypothetical protein